MNDKKENERMLKSLLLWQKYTWYAVVILFFGAGNARADIEGRVVKVLDGDTIEGLQVNNERSRIRLNGIDAPEKNSPLVSDTGNS